MPKLVDITGKKFNRLSVIEISSKRNSGGCVMWECICDCGNKSTVDGSSLRFSRIKSCGCYNIEVSIIKGKRLGKLPKKGTHRLSKTYLYCTWNNIKMKCTNPKNPHYKNYGARGIKIFEEWFNSFEKFREYIGDRPSSKHSIDRIDNNGNYEPGNIRWANSTQQAFNKRSNHLVTFNGVVKPVTLWANEYNIKYNTLIHRLNNGWPIEKALTTKPKLMYKNMQDNITQRNE